MSQCDMCGKEDMRLSQAIVEGSMMSVCKNCTKFGKVISVDKPEQASRAKIQLRMPVEKEIESIVPGYGNIVKKAREARSMKQEELAKKIAEKESVIHKIESGSFEPPIDLARKLERLLGVRLVTMEATTSQGTTTVDVGKSDMTIGDLIEIKKKSPK